MPPLHQLDWRRRPQPVLSAMTARQSWCRVQLYSPAVLKQDGVYRMWYLGNATATRTGDSAYPRSMSPVRVAVALPRYHIRQTPSCLRTAGE